MANRATIRVRLGNQEGSAFMVHAGDTIDFPVLVKVTGKNEEVIVDTDFGPLSIEVISID